MHLWVEQQNGCTMKSFPNHVAHVQTVLVEVCVAIYLTEKTQIVIIGGYFNAKWSWDEALQPKAILSSFSSDYPSGCQGSAHRGRENRKTFRNVKWRRLPAVLMLITLNTGVSLHMPEWTAQTHWLMWVGQTLVEVWYAKLMTRRGSRPLWLCVGSQTLLNRRVRYDNFH